MIVLYSYVNLIGKPLVYDEKHHYREIANIQAGVEAKKTIAMLPGYHYVIAYGGKIFGLHTLDEIRLLNAITNAVIAILVVYFSWHYCGYLNPYLGVIFLLNPMVVGQLSLVYTDIFSAFTVAFMVFLSINRRPLGASILSAFSFFTRQTNLIFIPLAWFLSVVSAKGFQLKPDRDAAKDILIKSIPFFIVGTAIAIFFYFNKGVAIGAARSFHNDYKINLTNLFVFALAYFYLFLPKNIYVLCRDYREIYRSVFWLSAVILVSAMLFYFSAPTHVFNTKYNVSQDVLTSIYDADLLSPLFLAFIPIALSIICMFIQARDNKKLGLIYVFSFLALVPYSFVVERYYITPVILMLIYEQPEKIGLSRLTALWMLVLAGVSLYAGKSIFDIHAFVFA